MPAPRRRVYAPVTLGQECRTAPSNLLIRITLTRHTVSQTAASAATSVRWNRVSGGKNRAHSQSIIQRPNVASVIEAYTVPPLMIGLTVTKQFR
jgi:hypothetical protein